MIISIASGKGGTGKTTVAVNLALSLGDVQFMDCDVEEPNAHIFLKPSIEETVSAAIPVPKVDLQKCNYCGKCSEACEFHAIVVVKEALLTFEELCHGCGACSYVCPEKAIGEEDKEIGRIEIGHAGRIRFVQGILNIGEPMATPVIRKEKRLLLPSEVTILDAPPGTSCPVIETVKGSDFCLLVTEPTPFGLNDLELAAGMVRKMGVPMGVVINRADVGGPGVKEFCRREGIPVVMEVPMDRRIAESYSRGIPVVEVLPDYRSRFLSLFKEITNLVEAETRHGKEGGDLVRRELL
ncbi:MAG: ATP-binding protein [Deltaproteobacteria bacterium]|nr:ATP-binding protein [Deltaproteobacteria bacterium]